MNILIPVVTDVLELESDWTYPLYYRPENLNTVQLFDSSATYLNLSATKSITHTLPAGTKLQVTEVGIRSSYFRIRNTPNYDYLKFKFNYNNKDYTMTANIEDVNRMEVRNITPASTKPKKWNAQKLRNFSRPYGLRTAQRELRVDHAWIDNAKIDHFEQFNAEMNKRIRCRNNWERSLYDFTCTAAVNIVKDKVNQICTVTFRGTRELPAYHTYGYMFDNTDVTAVFTLSLDMEKIVDLTLTWTTT